MVGNASKRIKSTGRPGGQPVLERQGGRQWLERIPEKAFPAKLPGLERHRPVRPAADDNALYGMPSLARSTFLAIGHAYNGCAAEGTTSSMLLKTFYCGSSGRVGFAHQAPQNNDSRRIFAGRPSAVIA